MNNQNALEGGRIVKDVVDPLEMLQKSISIVHEHQDWRCGDE